MKKIIFSSIIILGLLFGSVITVYATIADPAPITYTQPDGSKITIQLHGDEFLHWKTAGGRLVEVGKDGYVYFAEFTTDGKYRKTGSRVGTRTPSGSPSNVTIPGTAIGRAFQARANALTTNKERRAPAPMLSISTGNKPFLVLLIEFSDLFFTVDGAKTAFSNLLNQNGYSGTGSVFDYYNDNSSGQFTPQFDVVGPIRVSRGYSYYSSSNNGMGTPGARELIVEACQLIDGEVDFTKYDTDYDGYVDNIFFYFAGHNAAEGASDRIWPHASGLSGRFDGVGLGRYACSSEYRGNSGAEMCGIGTFCHEFGHVIGLPDFYDVDYESNGQAHGLGPYSLMSSGNYNNYGRTPPYLNSIEKNLLGWMGAPTAITAAGNYTMQPVENNFAYTTPTANSGEYFLYESRQPSGWDAHLPAHGLVIYHIDQSYNDVNGSPAYYRWSNWNGINAFAEHQCFDLVESIYPESDAYYGSQPFPGPNNNTSFTATTLPAARDWAGNATGYNLTNISNASGVSFTISVDMNTRITITGTVKTRFGTPIPGASVVITALESSSSIFPSSSPAGPDGIQLSPMKTSSTYTTTTSSDGTFSIVLDDGGNYLIDITASGYNSFSLPFYTLVDKHIDATMIATGDTFHYTLSKHSSQPGMAIGSGVTPLSMCGGVEFSAEELSAYSGFSIKSISFKFYGSYVSKAEVMVYFDRVKQYSQEVNSLLYGSFNTVDISAAGLTVPSGVSVLFAYSVENCDKGHPIWMDDGPYVTGGTMYSYDGKGWGSYTTSGNALIDAQISNSTGDDPGPFYNLGINAIKLSTTTFHAGDSITLALEDSNDAPSSTQWFFDDQSASDGATISLSAGEHVIKAVLTYSNGDTETVTQIIYVN